MQGRGEANHWLHCSFKTRASANGPPPGLCKKRQGWKKGVSPHGLPTWVLPWSFASVSMVKSFSITSIFRSSLRDV